MNTTITLDVAVEAEDIVKGQPGACETCPVALAIRRHLHPDVYISVDWKEIGLSRRGSAAGMTWLDTPPEVEIFVQAFDATEAVEPFVFHLNVPAWAVEDA